MLLFHRSDTSQQRIPSNDRPLGRVSISKWHVRKRDLCGDHAVDGKLGDLGTASHGAIVRPSRQRRRRSDTRGAAYLSAVMRQYLALGTNRRYTASIASPAAG